MPTLYIVSTPIGNLEDITLRALRVLGEVGLIAAEDTRVTRRLLTRYDIDTPLTSYHEHNKLAKIPGLLVRLEDIDIALVSDAGTPGVNDPGQELVIAAASKGHDVIGIPGASSLTTAIAVSGIAMEGFVFLGFQLLWIVALGLASQHLWRFRQVAILAMAALPLVYLAPHLFYQVDVYYPRHVVIGYLAMAAVAFYAVTAPSLKNRDT